MCCIFYEQTNVQIKWQRLKEQLRRFQKREVTLNNFAHSVHSTLFHCRLLRQENGILQGS